MREQTWNLSRMSDCFNYKSVMKLPAFGSTVKNEDIFHVRYLKYGRLKINGLMMFDVQLYSTLTLSIVVIIAAIDIGVIVFGFFI